MGPSVVLGGGTADCAPLGPWAFCAVYDAQGSGLLLSGLGKLGFPLPAPLRGLGPATTGCDGVCILGAMNLAMTGWQLNWSSWSGGCDALDINQAFGPTALTARIFQLYNAAHS